MKLHPKILLRVPQFSIHATLYECWDELKASIKYSSPEFYLVIKDVEVSDLDQVSEKVRHSIWKYFNRAKYRATPYGSFAGVGIVQPTIGKKTRIVIDQKQHLRHLPCWSSILKKERKPLTAETYIIANNTYYRVGNAIRYLTKEEGQFTISEIDFEKAVWELLQLCKTPQKAETLIKTYEDLSLSALEDLVTLQLIISEHTPNLICQVIPLEESEIFNTDSSYLITGRNIFSAEINGGIIKSINKAVAWLAQHASEPELEDLKRFNNKFLQRYGDKCVPIMQAIDQQVGVGYGELTRPYGRDEEHWAPTAFTRSALETNQNLPIGYSLLLQAIKDNNSTNIQLEHHVFQESKSVKELPNSISVLYSVYDDNIFLENVCGPSGTRLAGRFSLLNSEIAHLCKSLSRSDQDANPEVIFFDISIAAEDNVDNINRREQVNSSTLSILAFDFDQNQLSLEDIYILSNHGKLHLYSKKHNKRLIPRLSSAYNHSRSTLPLLRLLGDLQYQEVKANFEFRLFDLYPNMDFYPRMTYQNIIISPSAWRVNLAELKEFCGTKLNESNLVSYLRSKGMDRFILTRTEDRTLLFDLDNKSDMLELLYIISRFPNFLVEEAFLPSSPKVSDTKGQSYNCQHMVFLEHQRTLYKKTPYRFSTSHDQQTFAPGSDWLYYHIYIHPDSADNWLKNTLRKILSANKNRYLSWFFIRYNDALGEHLRIRFLLTSSHFALGMMEAVEEQIHPELEMGVLSDVQLHTYQREIERYWQVPISDVETHFGIDSRYALAVLAEGIDRDTKYWLCIRTIIKIGKEILGYFFLYQLVKDANKSFQKEFGLKSDKFKILNKSFASYQRKEQLYSVTNPMALNLEKLENSLRNIIEKSPEEGRIELFADLVHMSVNRQFHERQREHEMTIYYFLERILLKIQRTAISHVC